MKKFKSLSVVFHLLIIAMFTLSFSGCGYKANPYLGQESPKGDENVKFIVKEPIKR